MEKKFYQAIDKNGQSMITILATDELDAHEVIQNQLQQNELRYWYYERWVKNGYEIREKPTEKQCYSCDTTLYGSKPERINPFADDDEVNNELCYRCYIEAVDYYNIENYDCDNHPDFPNKGETA